MDGIFFVCPTDHKVKPSYLLKRGDFLGSGLVIVLSFLLLKMLKIRVLNLLTVYEKSLR